jgi:hypothetical protein
MTLLGSNYTKFGLLFDDRVKRGNFQMFFRLLTSWDGDVVHRQLAHLLE